MTTKPLPLAPADLSRADRELMRAVKDRGMAMLLDRAGGFVAFTPEELDAYADRTVILCENAEAGLVGLKLVRFDDVADAKAYRAAKA